MTLAQGAGSKREACAAVFSQFLFLRGKLCCKGRKKHSMRKTRSSGVESWAWWPIPLHWLDIPSPQLLPDVRCQFQQSQFDPVEVQGGLGLKQPGGNSTDNPDMSRFDAEKTVGQEAMENVLIVPICWKVLRSVSVMVVMIVCLRKMSVGRRRSIVPRSFAS